MIKLKRQSLAVLLLLSANVNWFGSPDVLVGAVENREGPDSKKQHSGGTGGTSLRRKAGSEEVMMADGFDVLDKAEGVDMKLNSKIEEMMEGMGTEETDVEEIGTRRVKSELDTQHGVDAMTPSNRSVGLDDELPPHLDLHQVKNDSADPHTLVDAQADDSTLPGSDGFRSTTAETEIADADVKDVAEGRGRLSSERKMNSSSTSGTSFDDDHPQPTIKVKNDNQFHVLRNARGLSSIRGGGVGIANPRNKSLRKKVSTADAVDLSGDHSLVLDNESTNLKKYGIQSFNSSSLNHNHQERELAWFTIAVIFIGVIAGGGGVAYASSEDVREVIHEFADDAIEWVGGAFEDVGEAFGDIAEFLDDVFSCPEGNTNDGCSVFCPCSGDNTCEAWHHVCRAPGKENDPCHLTRPCGEGFTCEAGSHKCRKPGEVGDPCHLTRPCKDTLTCSVKFYCEEGGSTGDTCDMGILHPCKYDHFCLPVAFICVPSQEFADEVSKGIEVMADIGDDVLSLLTDLLGHVLTDLGESVLAELADTFLNDGDSAASNELISKSFDDYLTGRDDVESIINTFKEGIVKTEHHRRLCYKSSSLGLTYYVMYGFDLSAWAVDVAFNIGLYVSPLSAQAGFFVDFGAAIDFASLFGKLDYGATTGQTHGLMLGGPENIPGFSLELSVGNGGKHNALIGITLPSPMPYFEYSKNAGIFTPGYDFCIGGGYSHALIGNRRRGRRELVELDALPNPYNLTEDLLKEQTKKAEKLTNLFPPSHKLSQTCTADSNKCGVCEGHCTFNTDCSQGLKCWHKSDTMSHCPGCTQTQDWKPLSVHGLCADIDNLENVENGMTVSLKTCDPHTWSQQWDITTKGYIQNRHTGKCLEAGVSPVLYSRVYLWDCGQGDHQIWHRDESSGRIQHNDKRFYLSVGSCARDSGDDLLGNRLELHRDPTSDNCEIAQKWIPDWKPLSVHGLCADIDNLENVENGMTVSLKTCDSHAWSQQWDITTKGYIHNRHTGKCLEAGVSPVLYSRVYLWDCGQGDHQIWHRDESSGRIQHNDKRFYLSVGFCARDSGDDLLGNRLELHRDPTSDNCEIAQKWIPDWKQLSVHGLCADIDNLENVENGMTVSLKTCDSHAWSQQWDITTKGYVHNRHTGKCLEAGVSPVLYSRVYLWDCVQEDHQIWHRDESSGRIQHNDKRFYLSVGFCARDSGDDLLGNRLELHRDPTSGNCETAQRWNLLTPREGYCFNPSMLRILEEPGTFFIRERRNGNFLTVAEGDCSDGLALRGDSSNDSNQRQEFFWGNAGQIYSKACPDLVMTPDRTYGNGPVVLSQNRNKASQKWESTSSYGLRTINQRTHSVLDVSRGKRVQMWTKTYRLNQQFDLFSKHESWFYVRDRKFGLYLTVDDGKCDNLLGLSMQEFNGSNMQKFSWGQVTIDGKSSENNHGSLTLQSIGCSGLIVDNSDRDCKGMSLHLYEYLEHPWQEWYTNGASLESRNCRGWVMDSTSKRDITLYKQHGGLNQQFDFVTEEYTKLSLDACEGSCNVHGDCRGNLKCWKRPGTPPGCLGSPQDLTESSYCYDPTNAVDVIQSPVDESLGMCEGNCFDDSDCGKHLKCWRRIGDDAGPPNCKGELRTDFGYCTDETIARLEDDDMFKLGDWNGWNELRLKDDFCADIDCSDEPCTAVLQKCSGEGSQQWKYVGGKLINRETNKCLTYSFQYKNVVTRDCSKYEWIREIDGRYRIVNQHWSYQIENFVLGVRKAKTNGLKEGAMLQIQRDVDDLTLGDITCGQTWNMRTGDCGVGFEYLEKSKTSLPWLGVCDGGCKIDKDCAPGLQCSNSSTSDSMRRQCKYTKYTSASENYCYGTKLDTVRFFNKGYEQYLMATPGCDGVLLSPFSESMRQEFYIDKEGFIASAYCDGKVLEIQGGNCEKWGYPPIVFNQKKSSNNNHQRWLIWNHKNEKAAGSVLFNVKCKDIDDSPLIVMGENWDKVKGAHLVMKDYGSGIDEVSRNQIWQLL